MVQAAQTSPRADDDSAGGPASGITEAVPLFVTRFVVLALNLLRLLPSLEQSRDDRGLEPSLPSFSEPWKLGGACGQSTTQHASLKKSGEELGLASKLLKSEAK